MTIAAQSPQETTPARRPNVLPKPNEACWCGSSEKYKKCHKDSDGEVLKAERRELEEKRVRPGHVSPKLTVPQEIIRPDYAITGVPSRGSGRHVRTEDEIVRMRHACKIAARVLRETGEQVRPGVTTDELDKFAHELIIKLGAYPSPLNYRGFPKSICTSVNEVICHGIPDDRVLLDGDIVNLDITVYLGGVHGDTNGTFLAGNVSEDSKRLVSVTHECMMKGIGAVKPGRPVSDIGRAIELYATAAGYGVVRSYCGHGIGDVFHSSLQIPHYFDARVSTKMEPGMTFTIEPMITAGSHKEQHWNDEWTVTTEDLRRTAQFEHTILVTGAGSEILTLE